MALIGRFGGFVWGHNDFALAISKDTNNSYAMPTANNGWCARFRSQTTLDVKSLWLYFNAITSPGTVDLRIETIDATTGKPTGTLYDANASKNFTPVTGWQNVAFASIPTTGLTVGNEYGLVLLKNGAGTTVDLNSHVARSKETAHPSAVLTATDGSTRSNFAEVINTIPILTVVFEDDVEETVNCCGFSDTTDRSVSGAKAVGAKIVTVGSMILRGIAFEYVIRTGTPDGDFRMRILNAANDSLVAGTTVTIDRDSLALVGGNRIRAHFDSLVTLPAGTYRVIHDNTNRSSTATNCFKLRTAKGRSSSVVSAGHIYTETLDLDAGTISWTDTASESCPVGLILDDLFAGGGSIIGGGSSMDGM
jgi:hypothetical protein